MGYIHLRRVAKATYFHSDTVRSSRSDIYAPVRSPAPFAKRIFDAFRCCAAPFAHEAALPSELSNNRILLCRILRLRRVANATSFHSDAVRSSRNVFIVWKQSFHTIKTPVDFSTDVLVIIGSYLQN